MWPATLTELGLTTTLGNFVREWSKEFAIAVEYHTRGLDGHRLPIEVEANVYRIAQEALNNAFKHAGATRVVVAISDRGGRVALEVCDNGRGFDPSALTGGEGLGLTSMRERAASIGASVAIVRRRRGGTRVMVELSTGGQRPAGGPPRASPS